VKTNELERDGFLGVVEFNPDDRIHGRIDAFYSKFDDEQTLRGAEIAGYTGSRDIISVGPDGLVTEGQWTGLQTQSRNDFSYRNVETRAIGFNLKYNPNQDWEIETDLSYSDAEREYTAYETYMAVIRGMGRPGDTGDTFNYRLGEGNGLVVDTDVDFSDPNVWQLGDNLGWGGVLCTEADGWQCDSQDGFVNTETSDDDLTAFKLAATHFVEGELIQSVTVGARYAERTKGHSKVGQFMMLPEYPDLVPIPEQYLRAPTNLGFVGLGDIVSYDPRGLVRDGFYVYRVESDISQALNDWTVNEDVANIYAMADIMSGKWSGNFGVQAVYTDQSSTGTQTGITPAGVEFVEVTLGDSFWELLPSVNLAYDINDSYKLRLGAARVLARPRMDQMRASLEFNFDENKINNTDIEDSPWGGNGGNPELKPWMAWQFDVSLETYFGAAGYAALSAYYKDLENYVYDKRILTDFSAALPLIPEEFRPVLSEGFYTAPENGKGGWIRGVEFSASLPFDLFNENLRSFGAFVSASWTDSEVQEDADSAPLQLPGLSETVINGTVYYENDAGFAARISARQRDKFLAEAFAIGLSREETIAKKETVVDAQLSMDMERFGWEGLSFYLQGQNLTNEPFVQYLDDNPTKFKNYHTYGRSYLAGFNFRM
jgi:iron complex outermembrane receptor protein